MRIQFGIGGLFMVGVGGNLPTDPTPQSFATLQDVNVDFGATIKDLRGQNQYPDDTAISDRKITWKAGFGRMDIDAYNNIIAAESSIGTGGQPMEVNEDHTIPASGPYTITVTNSADTPLTDFGVLYKSTGQKFTKVPSGVAAGEYTYSSGVYTFAAADAGTEVLISYAYTVMTGRTLTVNNHVQGYGPALEMRVPLPYQELTAGVPNMLRLFLCKVGKMGFPLKRADYLITDIEGEAYANAAGQVWELYED
jgi:hypothetical protein